MLLFHQILTGLFQCPFYKAGNAGFAVDQKDLLRVVYYVRQSGELLSTRCATRGRYRSPEMVLIRSAKMTVLNPKEITPWSNVIRRIRFVVTCTSDT